MSRPLLLHGAEYFVDKVASNNVCCIMFDVFRFLSCRHITPKSYTSELNSSTMYGQIPYGTQYFREEFPDIWLTKVLQSSWNINLYVAVQHRNCTTAISSCCTPPTGLSLCVSVSVLQCSRPVNSPLNTALSILVPVFKFRFCWCAVVELSYCGSTDTTVWETWWHVLTTDVTVTTSLHC